MNTVRFLAITLIFSFIFGLQPSITQDADAKGAKGKGATSVKAKTNRDAKPKTSVSKRGGTKKQGKVKKAAKRAGKRIKKGAQKAKAKAKQTLQKARQSAKKGIRKTRQKVKKGVQKTVKAAKRAKDSAKKARDKLLSKLKRDRGSSGKENKGKAKEAFARANPTKGIGQKQTERTKSKSKNTEPIHKEIRGHAENKGKAKETFAKASSAKPPSGNQKTEPGRQSNQVKKSAPGLNGPKPPKSIRDSVDRKIHQENMAKDHSGAVKEKPTNVRESKKSDKTNSKAKSFETLHRENKGKAKKAFTEAAKN